ncbi:hypothetical protein R1flu_004181 [Riccia fluitans]|uniref:Uncharacterized protein n=1 Tax=Riccia fluitans TaxID=41844 RepID=A0ABD1YPK0_9MARC
MSFFKFAEIDCLLLCCVSAGSRGLYKSIFFKVSDGEGFVAESGIVGSVEGRLRACSWSASERNCCCCLQLEETKGGELRWKLGRRWIWGQLEHAAVLHG